MKVAKIYTGTDEDIFHIDESIQKYEKFTVLFRGRFLPEAGIKYIISTAKILENQDINFLIIGGGIGEKEIESHISSLQPTNLEWINKYLSPNELKNAMLKCHISLGQFEKHIRLQRTIPHKVFESLAIGLPYITGRNIAISELLTDGENCLMVNNADPQDLAQKILSLKNNQELMNKFTEKGLLLYEEKLSSVRLGADIIQAIKTF